MRIRWLRTALRNLDEEIGFVAAANPATAERQMGTILQAIDHLKTQPAMGRPGRVTGTRERVVPTPPFLIPYRVRGDVVEILRVFHTARNPPARW
jgi:plasmid stabilization system protein ParE